MSVLLLIAVLVLLGIGYAWYAGIVRKKNPVGEALGGVDVQLTQRRDLVPNVLAVAKRFLSHERELLEQVTALRARAAQPASLSDPAALKAKFDAEAQLGGGLEKLFAVAEGYPELKSDATMVEAQRTYQEVETNIAAARRFYNSSVGDLRNSVQTFPGPLLAGLAGVGELPPFFEADASAREPVNAADHL